MFPWAQPSSQPKRHLDRFSHFWATVCKTVRPMLSDRCLVCLSVTLVYCGQTVGWIKTKLGKQAGLGPGHIVLDGTSYPSPKGEQRPILGTYLLCPNGYIDKYATWYGSRPQHKRHCVKWGPRSPSSEKGPSPPISAHVCCSQTAGWMKMALGT